MKYLFLYLAQILTVTAFSLLGRMGGSGKYSKLFRRLGIPLVYVSYLWANYGFNWNYLLVISLMYGALSTYWDVAFGYDCKWFSGLMVGLSAFTVPYFVLRAILLSILWELCKRYRTNGVTEELTRYFTMGVLL